MRPAALTTLLVALAITVTLPSTAHAATTRSVCAPTALLRDSPVAGFVIGHLRRGQRLQLQRHSANRRWALVVTRTGTVGWLQVTRLCRA